MAVFLFFSSLIQPTLPRSFTTNLLFLVFVNVVVKPLWVFGIDRTVQNTVGTEQYGTYFAVFNFSLLFYVILDSGIASFNSRTLAQDPNLHGLYWHRLLKLKLLLVAVYAIICVLGAFYLRYDFLQLHLLLCLAVCQILVSFIAYFRSCLQAHHHFRADACLSVLDRLFAIFVCTILLWQVVRGGTFNIIWFAYAQLAGYTLTAVIGYLLAMPQSPFLALYTNPQLQAQTQERGQEQEPHSPTNPAITVSVVHLIHHSAPFALMSLLMTAYMRLDVVLLKTWLPSQEGAREAGIYAASFRLLDAVNMIAVLFSTLLLPIFARQLAHQKIPRQLVRLSAQMLYASTGAFAALCVVFAQPIMSLLYWQATPYYEQVFVYVILGIIPISSVYVFGTLLTANGNLRLINVIAASGVVLNLTFNSLLIPTYKAQGAAMAALASQGFVALAFYFFSFKKILRKPPSFSYLLRCISYFALCIGLSFACKTIFANWQLAALLATLLCIALAFGIRLLNLNEMKNINKENG